MGVERVGEVSSRILTVPNLLSFARLLLVPVFLVLIIAGHDGWALLVLIFSSVTDFFDGLIARKFNQSSRLGQLLDPAADRLFIFAALIGLAVRGIIPWWLVAIIVGRDVMLVVLGIVLANHGYGPLPVHHLGKVATFCLFYALPMLMLGQAFPDLQLSPTRSAGRSRSGVPSSTGGAARSISQRRSVGSNSAGASPPPHPIRWTAKGGSDGRRPERRSRRRELESPAADNDDTTVTYGDEFAAQLAALDGDVTTEEQEAIAALPVRFRAARRASRPERRVPASCSTPTSRRSGAIPTPTSSSTT